MSLFNKIKNISLLVLIAASISSCAEKDQDLKKWVQDVKSAPVKPLDPIPSVEEKPVEDYNREGLRDPFMRVEPSAGSVVEMIDPNAVRPDNTRTRELLEDFDLDELVMVGTMNSGNSLLGLIRTPDKITHKVKPGQYMGRSDGLITSVELKSIKVRELVSNGQGGWNEVVREIQLSEFKQDGKADSKK